MTDELAHKPIKITATLDSFTPDENNNAEKLYAEFQRMRSELTPAERQYLRKLILLDPATWTDRPTNGDDIERIEIPLWHPLADRAFYDTGVILNQQQQVIQTTSKLADSEQRHSDRGGKPDPELFERDQAILDLLNAKKKPAEIVRQLIGRFPEITRDVVTSVRRRKRPA